jgi:hypothetical protein
VRLCETFLYRCALFVDYPIAAQHLSLEHQECLHHISLPEVQSPISHAHCLISRVFNSELHYLNTMCSIWTHCFIISLDFKRPYSYHVFALNTQFIYTMCLIWITQFISIMCSFWPHSLTIIFCVYINKILYPYSVFTCKQHSFHTMCSLWTPNLWYLWHVFHLNTLCIYNIH